MFQLPWPSACDKSLSCKANKLPLHLTDTPALPPLNLKLSPAFPNPQQRHTHTCPCFLPYLQPLPRARSFSGAPGQLPQSPCLLSSPACFLDKDRASSGCASASGHTQTLSMSADYILYIWSDQLNSHMAAKQELSLGCVTRVRCRRDSPLAEYHSGTADPYLGVTRGYPGWARDSRDGRCLFFVSNLPCVLFGGMRNQMASKADTSPGFSSLSLGENPQIRRF